MAKPKGKTRVLQANLHHAAAASAVVEVCFAEDNIDLALIQEPWVANGQVLGLAAAAVPKYCNDDLVTAFINLKGCTGARVIICSAYLPGENADPTIELERVAEFARKHNAELVVGCDANAHHTAWGSTNINERGSAKLINWIRAHGHAHTYAHAMSPPMAAQVLAAMRALCTPQGLRRVRTLRDNTHYFRHRLREMGVVTYGHEDSPVVPMMVFTKSNISATLERLTARGVATVGVGFPATPLYKSRLRFCLSAAHSREQLDTCLAAIQEVVEELGLQYSRRR